MVVSCLQERCTGRSPRPGHAPGLVVLHDASDAELVPTFERIGQLAPEAQDVPWDAAVVRLATSPEKYFTDSRLTSGLCEPAPASERSSTL
jgi:hypothetical protein